MISTIPKVTDVGWRGGRYDAIERELMQEALRTGAHFADDAEWITHVNTETKRRNEVRRRMRRRGRVRS